MSDYQQHIFNECKMNASHAGAELHDNSYQILPNFPESKNESKKKSEESKWMFQSCNLIYFLILDIFK